MKFTGKKGGGGGGGGGQKFGKFNKQSGTGKPRLSTGFKSKGKSGGASSKFSSGWGDKSGGNKFSGGRGGKPTGNRLSGGWGGKSNENKFSGGWGGKPNGNKFSGGWGDTKPNGKKNSGGRGDKRNGNKFQKKNELENPNTTKLGIRIPKNGDENAELKKEKDIKEENDVTLGMEDDKGFLFGDSENDVKKEEADDSDYDGGFGGKKGKNKKKAGGFQGMGLSPSVLKGVLRRGYNIPTPIQRKTIPRILEGRDVVAMARTGSGKTAAFLIPLFEKLLIKKSEIGTSAKFPRALILSPTRELATQTVKFIREIGKFVDFRVSSILGGESMESQFQTIHDKPDIVVATPGRFMHLCVEMELKLDGVEYVVFDEADRLFEMGFGEQLMEILKRLTHNRQTVMFSATLPKLLVDFSKAGLHDPTLIRLDVDTKLPEQLELTYLACRSEDKVAALLYLLKNIIDENQQTIVFTATKHHVEYIHQLLDEANVTNCYIYSSLDASARKISLGKFRSRKCNVMVVTDIAARGIDIPILDNVINFHFPAKPKLFMHRVGRVARAGRSGIAYSIICPDDIAFLIDLHLFLDRPLLFQKPSDDDEVANSQAKSAFVGRIPQDLLNDENNFIRNILEIRMELATASKVSRNGYSQYLKSRPNASTESNRRAKGIEISRLHVHPLFTAHVAEDPMDGLISQMQQYRPNATIFEIGPKTGSETQKVMKLKRYKDQKAVERHRSKSASDSVEVDKLSEKMKGKEDEPFIPYLPKDHHTELGLSVGTTFDKQVQEAVMDLTGDDSDILKQQRGIQKWDQKTKKFVSMGKDTNGKKIKTESGVWIAASYKSDRYKTWMQKSKAGHQDDDDEGSDDDSYARNGNDESKRKPAFSRKLVKTGKNEGPRGPGVPKGKRFRTELKRPDEILKQRKIKEKNMSKNQPKKSRKKKQRNSGGRSGGKKSSGKKK